MTSISTDDAAKVIAKVLTSGDDVMVHASLRVLGEFPDGLEEVIEAFLSIVGEQGTLVMMTDTRSFAKTGRFDINQPSETGLLTETFRQRPGVSRSVVPMVSFAAKGRRAEDYLHTYHSHLDATAPLTQLLKNNGKILLFGVGYEKCTLYHLSEERYGISENFYKTFSGVLCDGVRVLAPISQRYFVRRDMAVKKDPSIAGRMLEERGLATTLPLGDGFIRCFKARDFDACCMDALGSCKHAFVDCGSR